MLWGGEVYCHSFWCPSADTVSDDPTRHKPCRRPLIEKPAWLSAAWEGNYTGFDQILLPLEGHALPSLSTLATDLGCAEQYEKLRPPDGVDRLVSCVGSREGLTSH